jgi:hypothetical protein
MRPFCRIPLCLARNKQEFVSEIPGAGFSGAIFLSA